MPSLSDKTGAPDVHTLDDLKHWVDRSLEASDAQKADLQTAISDVFERQRQVWKASKIEAIDALSAAFGDRLAKLREELMRREATVANITRYFEEVVAELSEKAHRDPKTKLLNYDWFMGRIESFLAVEQRVRWSALGVVDLTGFKWINDHLGHAVGDRIIARVARILSEHLRARDLLAKDVGGERRTGLRELHARFGGDEFCFFVPALSRPEDAAVIASRFKRKLEEYPWQEEHSRLLTHPVRVDVGVVCVELGSLRDRHGATHSLAVDLVHCADRLMYRAKRARSEDVDIAVVRVESGKLVDFDAVDSPVPMRSSSAAVR